jgi:hypothetical protein
MIRRQSRQGRVTLAARRKGNALARSCTTTAGIQNGYPEQFTLPARQLYRADVYQVVAELAAGPSRKIPSHQSLTGLDEHQVRRRTSWTGGRLTQAVPVGAA